MNEYINVTNTQCHEQVNNVEDVENQIHSNKIVWLSDKLLL